MEQYLDCGRLHGGFARIHCRVCRGKHPLVFWCPTRNVCPSCQTKRAALFGQRLVTAVRAPVPHRRVVFAIPNTLRWRFARERWLLSLLSRCAYDCVQRALRAYFDEPTLAVRTVATLLTFGSYAANFNPCVHAIVTS